MDSTSSTQKETQEIALPIECQRFKELHPFLFKLIVLVVKPYVWIQSLPFTLRIKWLQAGNIWLHFKLKRMQARTRKMQARLEI
jgi:hypothetical protein